jgi:hypothetical protein
VSDSPVSVAREFYKCRVDAEREFVWSDELYN